MEMSVFVKYYSYKNYKSQLSIDTIFLVKIWALLRPPRQFLSFDLRAKKEALNRLKIVNFGSSNLFNLMANISAHR